MYRVDDGIFGNEREEKNSVNVSTFVVHSIYKVLFVCLLSSSCSFCICVSKSSRMDTD